jgi:hypothetical protein
MTQWLNQDKAKAESVSNYPKNKIAAVSEEAKRVPRNFVPIPFRYHKELILTVETLTNLGVGIGCDISAYFSLKVDASEAKHSNGQYFGVPRKKKCESG